MLQVALKRARPTLLPSTRNLMNLGPPENGLRGGPAIWFSPNVNWNDPGTKGRYASTANVAYGSWPFQNASLGRSESREVGDARGMFRSDYALIAAISGRGPMM